MGAWSITRKDLLLLARDRRALAVLVALPLVFIAILGATTGRLLGWKDENQQLRIVVVDEMAHEQIGRSARNIADGLLMRKNARQLAAELIETLSSRDGFRVAIASSVGEARQAVRDGRVNAALFIGPEFFQRVEGLRVRDLFAAEEGRLAGGLAALDLRIEARSATSATTSLLQQLVLADAVRTVAAYVGCKNNLVELQLRAKCAEYRSLEEPAPPPKPLATPRQPAGSNRGQIVYQELVPGYTVMFVFFLVNIMGRSFIQERELGTLRRLRLAPVTTVGLVVGKTLPFFLISLTQTAVLFLSGRVLFGMSWGHQPLWLLPVMACTSLAATGLGLLLAASVRSDSQVSAYGNFLVITMAGISGCFLPRDWLPELLQHLSLATPHAWSLMAYYELLSTDAPAIGAVLQSCGMLIAFAAGLFALGCRQFTRSQLAA